MEGWSSAPPESQGFSAAKLDALGNELAQRGTHAFLVIRHDRLVVERHAAGYSRTPPHYTASLAKALVGGLALMVSMDQARLQPEDLVSKSEWISWPVGAAPASAPMLLRASDG